jgi:fructose-1,6-bisphosphatase/inositol monophosphatase family enzyme
VNVPATAPADDGPDGDRSALRRFCEGLAVEAGTGALAGRRALGVGRPGYDTKSSPTDPVTEYDRAAETLIVAAIRARFPLDSIVGEEGTDHVGSSSRSWHIDPIDGTANFVYDLAGWCTSIAVVDEAGPLAGAVYVPVAGELFSAVRDLGALLNGLPIHCSSATDLAGAMIATGFSYTRDRRRRQAVLLARLLPDVRDVRRSGSAALDLCSVACARVDAYYEEHLNSWDLAAGVLIASEAGAITSNFVGGPAGADATVAAAPGVHRALVDALLAAGVTSDS